MIISNTLNLSDGSTASGVFMAINMHTGNLETTGKAPVDLFFWRSESAKNAGKTNIYPLDTASQKITSIVLTFTGSEVVKAGSGCTVADTFAFYKQQVANKLLADYGWNVTV